MLPEQTEHLRHYLELELSLAAAVLARGNLFGSWSRRLFGDEQGPSGAVVPQHLVGFVGHALAEAEERFVLVGRGKVGLWQFRQAADVSLERK